MCLLIGNKKGHIAVKDIVCFKMLELNNGKYRTPYKKTEVTLGEYLVPDSADLEIFEYGFKYKLEGGVIHAYLDLSDCESRYTIFKAIIKKGTRFWLQDNLSEIAAEKLFITEEEVSITKKFNYKSLIPYALKVRTKDGYKVSLEDVSDYKDILGVYTSKSLVSLNLYYGHLSKTKSLKFHDDNDRDKGLKDYDGPGNTKNLDVKYLGDHEYIPSIDELIEALMEMAEMNIVRKILKKTKIPYGWFWSSTMREKEYAWRCGSSGNYELYNCNCVHYKYLVLPFLELS